MPRARSTVIEIKSLVMLPSGVATTSDALILRTLSRKALGLAQYSVLLCGHRRALVPEVSMPLASHRWLQHRWLWRVGSSGFVLHY